MQLAGPFRGRVPSLGPSLYGQGPQASAAPSSREDERKLWRSECVGRYEHVHRTVQYGGEGGSGYAGQYRRWRSECVGWYSVCVGQYSRGGGRGYSRLYENDGKLALHNTTLRLSCSSPAILVT
eukprot:3638620-Rhodomonas_salina.1